MSALEILNKIYNNFSIKYNCTIKQSHGCKSFCTICKEFICFQCFITHSHDHKLIKFPDTKLGTYKNLLTKIKLNKVKTENALAKIDKLIKKLKDIYIIMLNNFEFNFSLLEKYKIEQNNFGEKEMEDLNNIYNNLCKEGGDKNEDGNYLIELNNLLENAIKKNEKIISYNKVYNNIKEFHNDIYDKTDKNYNNIKNELLEIETKIAQCKHFSKLFFMKYLNVSEEDYKNQERMIKLKSEVNTMKKEKNEEESEQKVFKTEIIIKKKANLKEETNKIPENKLDEKQDVNNNAIKVENPYINSNIQNSEILEQKAGENSKQNLKISVEINNDKNQILEENKEKAQNLLINNNDNKKDVNDNNLKNVDNEIKDDKSHENAGLNNIKTQNNISENNEVKGNENLIINNNEKNKNNCNENIKNNNNNNDNAIKNESSNDKANANPIDEIVKEENLNINSIIDNNNNNIDNEKVNEENRELEEITNNPFYNFENFEDENKKINDFYIFNDNNKKNNILDSANNVNLDASLIHIDNFEVFTNENITNIVKNKDAAKSFDKVRTIKEYDLSQTSEIVLEENKILKESDIEVYRKNCIAKMKKLESKINIYSSPINEVLREIKIFDKNENNMIEILSPKNNDIFINIFNPYLNEIEKVLIPDEYKFNIDFAFLNILPYCYISGGYKYENNEEKPKILSEFFAIRRREKKRFKFIKLPEMLEPKFNHCMVQLKCFNGILAIGGHNSKNVEYFSLDHLKWINLPQLNHARENPSCCIINEKNIFCFLGYDNELNKYNDTIEKLNINLKNIEWEVIKPTGLEGIMLRKSASCLFYNHRGNDYIFIVGGVDKLGNQCKDILIYDEKKNVIRRKKNRLPLKSSFSQNSFNLLCSGYYCNFNSDSSIIQYEQMGEVFFSIRKN